MRISSSILIVVAVGLLTSSAIAQATFGEFVVGTHARGSPYEPLTPEDVEFFTELETSLHKSIEVKAKSGALSNPVFIESRHESQSQGRAGYVDYWYLRVDYTLSTGTVKRFSVLFLGRNDSTKVLQVVSI